jgi:hypothetical protein
MVRKRAATVPAIRKKPAGIQSSRNERSMHS